MLWVLGTPWAATNPNRPASTPPTNSFGTDLFNGSPFIDSILLAIGQYLFAVGRHVGTALRIGQVEQ